MCEKEEESGNFGKLYSNCERRNAGLGGGKSGEFFSSVHSRNKKRKK
jgi:hypothetical protein